jgi:hypothetical protein
MYKLYFSVKYFSYTGVYEALLSIVLSIVLYKAYYLPRPKRQYVRSLVTSLEIVFGNLKPSLSAH